MINVLLEPSPNEGEVPLVLVHIPDEDTENALAAINYAQRAALREREAVAGMPTTYHDSENPKANPLSECEVHYADISDQLFSNQGWFVSHTLSDSYRNLDADAPDGVMVSYDRRKLGTLRLQGIRTGVRLAYEERHPPVLGASLSRLPYIGRALGVLLNIANREARRLDQIEQATTAYLNTLMSARVVSPEEAAYIRDIRTYEEKRYMEEVASLEQAQREAEWPEESRRLAAQRVRQHLSNPDHVAMLREMVAAKRAAQKQ